MITNPKNFSRGDKRRLNPFQSGYTLMEVVVAVGLGTLILCSVVVMSVVVANTMVAIGNYDDLDRLSTHTLDQFSHDVRNASSVTNNSDQAVTLVNSYEKSTTKYQIVGTSLVRTYLGSNGVSLVSTNLKSCDIFQFSYYQRNPTNSFLFITNSSAAQVKLISVSWRCSRHVINSTLNTESVQTANVVQRN